MSRIEVTVGECTITLDEPLDLRPPAVDAWPLRDMLDAAAIVAESTGDDVLAIALRDLGKRA